MKKIIAIVACLVVVAALAVVVYAECTNHHVGTYTVSNSYSYKDDSYHFHTISYFVGCLNCNQGYYDSYVEVVDHTGSSSGTWTFNGHSNNKDTYTFSYTCTDCLRHIERTVTVPCNGGAMCGNITPNAIEDPTE